MTRKLAAIAAGLMLIIQLFACGGPGIVTPTPSPSPTVPPCTQTLVLQDAGSVPSDTLVTLGISTSTSGRLDVIVDWTFTTSTMGVYVVQGSCTLAQFNARTCNFLIRSESGSKPRRLSALNVAPGAYELFIGNFGTVDEAASTQVFLSSPSCPPLAGVVTGSEAGRPGFDTPLTAILRR